MPASLLERPISQRADGEVLLAVDSPDGEIPQQFHWVFWDVDPTKLDPAVGADYVIPRILEFGGIAEVRWAIETYGMEGLHRFLRDVGHPELSKRTLGFWRAALKAENEPWASPPSWRKSSAAPWIA